MNSPELPEFPGESTYHADPGQEKLEQQKPKCSINLEPMADWVNKDKGDDFCRPCIMPVTISWYKDELKEKGFTDLGNQLTQAQESGDPAAVAEVMDSIKEQVPHALRHRLLEFDCATQEFAAEQEETTPQ